MFHSSYRHKSTDKDKAYHISCNILYLQIGHLDVTMLTGNLQDVYELSEPEHLKDRHLNTIIFH